MLCCASYCWLNIIVDIPQNYHGIFNTGLLQAKYFKWDVNKTLVVHILSAMTKAKW